MSTATSARTSGARRGRPVAAVNPLELLTCWEGRGGEAAARGGRPSTTINDADLRAAWEAAYRRGKTSSISALARTLHVSRNRVRARLQELGLQAGKPSVDREP